MKNKISMKEKFAYGLGDLGSNIILAAISFYLLYFMIKYGGLNAGLASLVFLLAKFWDAVTDYLMGRISDKTHTKFGKRKFFMLVGALPFWICFVLLWLLPGSDSQAIKFIYYLGIYCLFNTAFTVVYIPYNALSANMTDNYDERTSINSFRISMAFGGTLIGAALFSVLSEGQESLLYPLLGSEKYTFLAGSAILGALAFLCMMICIGLVKERYESSENTYGFFKTLKQFFKLKEFRNSTLFYLLSYIGFDFVMAIFMFFVADTLGFGSGIDAMIYISIPLLTAIIFAPLWVHISSKIGKTKTYTIAAIWTAVALAFSMLIPNKSVNEVGSIVGLVLVCFFGGLSMGALQILPWATIPDVVDIDEYNNGVRREGAYYGIISFAYKLASGISIAIVSLIIGAFGYVEGAGSYIEVGSNFVQPDSALMAIRVILSVLPGLAYLAAIIFAWRSNIKKERIEKITEELHIRRAAAGEAATPLQTATVGADIDAPTDMKQNEE